MHEDESTTTDAPAAEAAGEQAFCRHCGQPNDDAVAGSDFQCASCERWQDTIACPTCGSPARISLLPADAVPEPHAPARRRRSGG